MKVLIFEPVHTGHRFEYLRRIIPATCALGADVTVASTAEAFDSEQFRLHLASIEPSFSKFQCRRLPATGLLARLNATADELGCAVRAVGPDHVYVPEADGLSQVLGLRQLAGGNRVLRGVCSEGLHLRGAYGYRLDRLHERVKSSLAGSLASRAPWSVFYHLDPWQLNELCRRHPDLRSRAAVMPDPVDAPPPITRSAARIELGIPAEATYLGCAGPITRRKGGDLLLAAFAVASAQLPTDAKLLLAGKIDAGLREYLDSGFAQHVSRGRIVVIDRHLSTREMDIVIPAMDIVATPYRNHSGSSGIVLRAAAAGRPVLAANRYWMNNVVTTFGLGTTFDVHDQRAFVAAITRAFDDLGHFAQTDRTHRLLRFQSEQNFLSTWTSGLRERMGLRADPDKLSWDWVMNAGDLT